MYTIIPGKEGAQEYYNSLFELYASWGLDFVKVDDLSSPIYFTEEVEMIRKAMGFHQNRIAKAAASLGITRSALYRRLEKYNIPYDEAED